MAAISKEQAFKSIQSYCLAKEAATEDHPWGDTAWKVGGKMFACGCEGGNSFSVKSTLEKQAGLVAHPNIEVAAYVGRYGWVTITINDSDTLELAQDLIDESYELVKPKRKKSSPKE